MGIKAAQHAKKEALATFLCIGCGKAFWKRKTAQRRFKRKNRQEVLSSCLCMIVFTGPASSHTGILLADRSNSSPGSATGRPVQS